MHSSEKVDFAGFSDRVSHPASSPAHMHIDAYALMRIKSSWLIKDRRKEAGHGAGRRNPRMPDGTSDDGLRARQDVRLLDRLLLEGRPPADLPRALQAARPRLHPGPRGR